MKKEEIIHQNVFLKRMFIYKLQYLLASAGAFLSFICGMDYLSILKKTADIHACALCMGIFAGFNTITYFYSQYLAKKYGIEMFSDLDQKWLTEHQAFDSKTFGEYFSRLIQCRKIAGPYMFAVIVPCVLFSAKLAVGVGVVYLIGYVIYRETYLNTAISYKLPRAFGGGGVIVSKIIDHDFNEKIDNINHRRSNETR